MNKNILLLLTIIIFSGCVTKIDFKKYDLQEYVENKNIEYKKKPNLPIENISASTSSHSLISNNDFAQNIKFNDYYYSIFNPSSKNNISSNIKLDIRLEKLGYYVEYIPSRAYEYKGKTKYTESYYDMTVYSHIKARLTKPDGSIEVFEDDTQYSYKQNIEYFYGWGNMYTPKHLYSDVLENNLDRIFIIARNRLSNPFTIIKVLKEIKPEKGKSIKYAIAINGGSCNGLSAGQRANIYNNNNLIGYGEVTSQTSCKDGWILIEDTYNSPSVYDKVIVDF